MSFCFFDWEMRSALDLTVTGTLKYVLDPSTQPLPPPTPKHEVAHNNGSRVSAYYKHLRWATRSENHADMQVHKTAVKGGRNGRALLTDETAFQCRREYRQLKAKGFGNAYGGFKALQEKYGLGRTALRMLGLGQTWQHLPDDEDAL